MNKAPRLAPLRAIRKYCLWCCCNSFKEVELCPIDTCALYKYRSGKGLGPKVKRIRSQCLECSAGNNAEVRRCAFADCTLHQFRMGGRAKSLRTDVEIQSEGVTLHGTR